MESDNVVGVSNKQDLFETLKSFPIIKNIEKAEIHGCLDCYQHCMVNANNINRKKYEAEYILARDAAGFDFRNTCVGNFIRKTYTPPPELLPKKFHV